MSQSASRLLTFASLLALGLSARGQTVGTRVPEGSGGSTADQPAPSTDRPAASSGVRTPEEPAPEKPKKPPPENLHEWLLGPLSQEEDRDGPINTDRPTFTPANTVVPKGRLQFESGWTFNGQQASGARSYVYDFPELAMRYGLIDRVEFRMVWEGQTYSQNQARTRGPWTSLNGASDMEVGFKWQLFPGDEKRKWIPTTALITSIFAPTGGTSPYSSQTVEPYINLIYGWSLTKKLTLGGSTGYLGIREQGTPNQLLHSYNYERYQQSIVAFYSITEETTLFYEWYIWTFTNSSNNLPLNYMDGGILYRFTPNIQVDIRAGFGLSGRPNDFFTGTGFSVRF
jgi:Putative MetA-pathway of phenol degradation